MTVRRKKRGGLSTNRTVTVAFSLCLLATATMFGMYAVGRTEQQQEELEQQVADAEEKAQEIVETQEKQAAQEAAQAQEEAAQQKQAAASASAARDRTEEESADDEMGAELESDFAVAETDAAAEAETAQAFETAVNEEPTLSFSADSDQLIWPIAGTILLDYSMDKTVYFATLDQYKYNPAMIIQGTLDESVMSAAQGKVTKVETLEETGTTVTVDIGDGYQLIYGQLKEVPVKEGDYIKAGETIGYVAEPTRYYSAEGCNLYFAMEKDGESVDPKDFLQ